MMAAYFWFGVLGGLFRDRVGGLVVTGRCQFITR